jgi:hypothetical protein
MGETSVSVILKMWANDSSFYLFKETKNGRKTSYIYEMIEEKEVVSIPQDNIIKVYYCS